MTGRPWFSEARIHDLGPPRARGPSPLDLKAIGSSRTPIGADLGRDTNLVPKVPGITLRKKRLTTATYAVI
jgi:hypothetical protein